MKRGWRAIRPRGRPPARSAAVGLGRRDAGEDKCGQRRHARLRQEGGGEHVGHPQIHGVGDQLRADDTGEDAAGHHQRQGAGPLVGRHAIGGGEAEGEDNRRIGAAEEGRRAEQPERADDDGKRRQQADQDAADRTGKEGGAPAVTLGDGAGRQRAGGHADDEDGDRKRRQRRGRCQRMPDDRAGGEDHDGVGAGQRLDDGEADDIAAAVLVEGRGLGGSGLGRRSIGHEGNLTGGAGPERKNAGPGVDHRIADREYEQK